jgi:hypothetical protein
MSLYKSLKYMIEKRKGDSFHAWALQEIDDLRELLMDLADDAGYNLAYPPEHYCSDERCMTCEIWHKCQRLGEPSE